MKEIFLKLKDNLLFSKSNFKSLKADLLSALSVALLALPQSMAYALIVGLPLYSGILAAIFGTILTSSFGHSKHLISGPTNATALLIQSGTSHILYQHFNELPEELKGIVSLQILSQIVLMMGVIQLLIGVFKLGGFTQFISRSVMMGYLIGVALSIWIGQIYTILDLEKPKETFALIGLFPPLLTQIHKLNPITTALGLFSLITLVFFKKKYPKLPRAMIVLFFGAGLAACIKLFFPGIAASSIENVSLPKIEISRLFGFHFVYLSREIVQDLLIVSFAIALLSIFEVNSITRLISGKSGKSIRPNRDILAVGISNFMSSFFVGVLPSSGSPSRSMLNYYSGAKTKRAGIFTGLFLILTVSLFSPWVKYIPTASLAALLLVIGFEIIDPKLLKICLRATKRDASVLLVTIASCLFFQLDIALFMGIALSLVLYLRLAAQTNINEYIFTEEGHFKPIQKSNELIDKRIRILDMQGNLFFGSIDSMQKKLQAIAKDQDVQIIILRLAHVQHLDASICYFLEVFAKDLTKRGKSLYLCEINYRAFQIVHESPLLKNLSEDYLYATDQQSPIRATEKAFAHALKKLNET